MGASECRGKAPNALRAKGVEKKEEEEEEEEVIRKIFTELRRVSSETFSYM
jgi:hypothetical protein